MCVRVCMLMMGRWVAGFLRKINLFRIMLILLCFYFLLFSYHKCILVVLIMLIERFPLLLLLLCVLERQFSVKKSF